MQHHISAITLLVDDYDSAIKYYTETLSFVVTQDRCIGEDARFVLLTPQSSTTSLLLAKADSSEEQALIGKQAGNRVFMIMHTDDFWRDHALMKSKGVTFMEQPREEPYGIVAIFKDCYGNRWDLLQPSSNQ